MWEKSYGSLTIEFASVIDKLRAVVLRAYDNIILFEFTSSSSSFRCYLSPLASEETQQ